LNSREANNKNQIRLRCGTILGGGGVCAKGRESWSSAPVPRDLEWPRAPRQHRKPRSSLSRSLVLASNAAASTGASPLSLLAANIQGNKSPQI